MISRREGNTLKQEQKYRARRMYAGNHKQHSADAV